MTCSPLVRFGTSTWTYEGWQGQVYARQYAKSTFARECLGEYCQYQYKNEPLFRTVGNDATFYRPPTANQLRRYLNQIPEDFEMCFKVWEEITNLQCQDLAGDRPALTRYSASLTVGTLTVNRRGTIRSPGGHHVGQQSHSRW